MTPLARAEPWGTSNLTFALSGASSTRSGPMMNSCGATQEHADASSTRSREKANAPVRMTARDTIEGIVRWNPSTRRPIHVGATRAHQGS